MLKEHTSPVDFAAQWMASGFPAVSHDPQGRTIRVTFTDRANSVRHAIVTSNYDRIDSLERSELFISVTFVTLITLAIFAVLFSAFTLGAKYGASSVRVPTQCPLQIERVPVPGMGAKPTIRNAS